MKKLTTLFKKKWVWVILVIAATIPTFTSLMRPGFFPMQEDRKSVV